MIRNPALVESFERSLSRREAADHKRNLRIFEALYREARTLGVIPLRDALDGIDVDIRLAGVLNDRKVAAARHSRA
jgi:hypothetical protein